MGSRPRQTCMHKRLLCVRWEGIEREAVGETTASAEAGGGPQDVVARRYRRYAEEISVALQVALYGSHLCFLTVSVTAPAILAQAPANDWSFNGGPKVISAPFVIACVLHKS